MRPNSPLPTPTEHCGPLQVAVARVSKANENVPTMPPTNRCRPNATISDPSRPIASVAPNPRVELAGGLIGLKAPLAIAGCAVGAGLAICTVDPAGGRFQMLW